MHVNGEWKFRSQEWATFPGKEKKMILFIFKLNPSNRPQSVLIIPPAQTKLFPSLDIEWTKEETKEGFLKNSLILVKMSLDLFQVIAFQWTDVILFF